MTTTNQGLESKKYQRLFWIWISTIAINSIYCNTYLDPTSDFFNILLATPILLPLFLFTRNFSSLFKNANVNIFSSLFLLSVILSSISGINKTQGIIYGLLTSTVIHFSYGFIDKIKRLPLNSIYIYPLTLTIVFSAYFFQTGYFEIRLFSKLNPNVLGLYFCIASISSIFIKNKFFSICFFILFTYHLILTGSRSAMLGLSISLTIFLFLKLKKPLPLTIAITSIILSITILLSQSYQHEILDFFYKTTAIKDKYRGIKSGFSGRSTGWAETLNLFYENPLFGVGYRGHEKLLRSISSSHNGYLALLSELGVFGFVIVASAMIKSLYSNFKKDYKTKLFSITISSAYLVICFFERYLFNIGNSSSVIFLFIFTYGISITPSTHTFRDR